jgi:hypothetical protein
MSFKTQNIEFVIKVWQRACAVLRPAKITLATQPKEELVLVGKERTLVRVRKDETYP